jgi:hypothetical protein
MAGVDPPQHCTCICMAGVACDRQSRGLKRRNVGMVDESRSPLDASTSGWERMTRPTQVPRVEKKAKS